MGATAATGETDPCAETPTCRPSGADLRALWSGQPCQAPTKAPVIVMRLVSSYVQNASSAVDTPPEPHAVCARGIPIPQRRRSKP